MTSASPRSILVLSGRYHIISNASLVNNCIMFASNPPIVMALTPMVAEATLSINTLTVTVASPPVSVNMLKKIAANVHHGVSMLKI